MQPITKQDPLPSLHVGEPTQNQNRLMIPLSWKNHDDQITARLLKHEETPNEDRLMEAIDRDIDRFHREVRRSMHGEDKEDEIRQVK